MKEFKTKEQKRKFYDCGEWKRLREEVNKCDNYEFSNNLNLDKHYITKNYTETNASEGGEKENDGET